MANNPTVARATHANRGIEMKYRRSIEAMIELMHTSTLYWLQAAYRKNPPRMAAVVAQAQDASLPTLDIMAAINELRGRWTKFFAESAKKMAETFTGRMFSTSDRSFQASLKDAGWAVKMEMTPAMRDAVQASIQENIGLIRSIPEQYLGQVEGIVMRNYAAGRQLKPMADELRALYPKAANRAKLISRDQSNKIHTVTTRARQLELGITEAIWMHSHGGKEPRPDHVAANGRKYNVAEGCLISGELIYPGTKINCRCSCKSVFPFEVAQ